MRRRKPVNRLVEKAEKMLDIWLPA